MKAQGDAIESMEAKAGYLMASEGIVLTLVSSTLIQNNNSSNSLLILIGTVLLLLGILLTIGVFWSRYFQMGLPISNFYNEFHNQTDDIIHFKTLYTLNSALKKNAKSIENKSTFFILSLIVFMSSLVLIVSGFAFHDRPNYNHYMSSSDNHRQSHEESQQNHHQDQQSTPQSQSGGNQPIQSNDIWSDTNQTAGTTPSNLIKGGEDCNNR